jgi:heme exporter protein C
VGSVNLPIIKFSVDWWNTLHQPSSILRAGGPAVHSSMLVPLLVMFGAFLCYFVVVHILRTRAELTERKIRNLRLSADPTA